MKKKIHMLMNDVIFRDIGANVDFITKSTVKSDVVEEINGVKYFVLNVDVSSKTHPFYTGKKTVIDTAGRVDKYNKRQSSRKKV